VVSETLHQVLTVAGMPHRPARRRLRLLDLRHTFAVRALEGGPETRDAVGRPTLALTTSMGHACVLDTYWYLDTTPQLMTDMATACETCMQGGTS
jgi:integrase/recombinase XerD